LARPSDVPRALFWLSAQSICAECLTKALGKELKKIKFTHSNLFFMNLHPYKKHMLKFHIKIDIYFVFNNFISF
jgi:hypothetical protein